MNRSVLKCACRTHAKHSSKDAHEIVQSEANVQMIAREMHGEIIAQA